MSETENWIDDFILRYQVKEKTSANYLRGKYLDLLKDYKGRGFSLEETILIIHDACIFTKRLPVDFINLFIFWANKYWEEL